MSAPTCGETRRILWPDGAPRVATGEVLAARQHVTTCDACRAFMDDMRRLATAVSSLAPRETAPADVRERLFTAVARARAGRPGVRRPRLRTNRLAAGLAAAVLLATGVALQREARRWGGEDLPAALATEHARSGNEARINSSDAALVTRWLAPRVAFAAHVPSLPDANLRGARVVLIRGRHAAVMEYEVRGTAISYFVVPEPDQAGSPRKRDGLEVESRSGYRVVTWREPGLLHAMVGDLPGSELARLARACIEQMGRTMASGDRAWRLPST